MEVAELPPILAPGEPLRSGRPRAALSNFESTLAAGAAGFAGVAAAAAGAGVAGLAGGGVGSIGLPLSSISTRPSLVTVLVTLASAPLASSALITAGRFSAAAYINAVCPCAVSFALTFAPLSSNALTASALPEDAASISAVVP